MDWLYWLLPTRKFIINIKLNEELNCEKIRCLFAIIALILSHVMCAVVAYNYAYMLCAIEHCGNSAPAGVAFIYAIPFALLILISVILSVYFFKKQSSWK